LKLGFHQDIAIWENKLFREVPVLCDGDGPIMKLRKWYAQFYMQSAQTAEAVPDDHA
jgi:3-ketosteroid 9alpha-monooxygenase subunit A